MRKFIPSLITLAIWTTLYSSETHAKTVLSPSTTDKRCLSAVPIFDKPLIKGDTRNLPIKIETDTLKAEVPSKVSYHGNVRAVQGNRYVNAEHLIIETQPDNTHFMTLKGNVNYLDNFLKLHGKQVTMTAEKNDLKINEGQYHLVDRLGRGEAKSLFLRDNRYVILKSGSFTSCPIGDNSWSINGTTIVHDNEEELLEVWNAVFKIGPVPVLYSPYLQYPTGNKRRSGLLIPTFNYNNIDGLNIAQPFYWNIAPNVDTTITPRFIEHRGLQLQTESRYLNDLGLGTLAFDWFNHDRLYASNKEKIFTNIGDNKQRWLFHWDHEGIINDHWRIRSNMTRVSDRQYLIDLNSNFANVTDGYLTQTYQVGYANEDWDISLSSTNFQVFRSSLKNNAYRTEPQLDINYYKNSSSPLRFNTYAQLVNFTSPGEQNPETIRAHIAPSISYLLANAWASLNTEASLLSTHYHQDLKSSSSAQLERNVNRVMPKLSVDGQIILRRNLSAMEGYTQTLEPRIKYQYIPYRDQSRIKNYDSALMQLDYVGLFRDQIFSGLDRIASANQLTAGITTRFYDPNFTEQMNFSLGQIYYFKQSRTGDINLPTDKKEKTGSVSWATDGFLRLTPSTIIRGALQYDTRLNELSLANGIFEYHPKDDTLFQLSYRYASEKYIDSIDLGAAEKYIDSIASAAASPYKQAISQVGTMGSIPVSNSIALVGGYYYDTKLKQSADSFIGLQYGDCCWGFTVIYGRKIVNWEAHTQRSEYDNKLSVSFELRGFGRNRNNIAKMLDYGLLPYRPVL